MIKVCLFYHKKTTYQQNSMIYYYTKKSSLKLKGNNIKKHTNLYIFILKEIKKNKILCRKLIVFIESQQKEV